MPTLKEMNYRKQQMPDGCWNCTHHFEWAFDYGEACREAGDVDVGINGVCDRFKVKEEL